MAQLWCTDNTTYAKSYEYVSYKALDAEIYWQKTI